MASNAIPDPLYVGSPTLQHYYVDKDTGAPLAAGQIRYFKDSDGTTPKDVYMLTSPPYTFTNVGSVVSLSSVGTPQYNGIDFIPYLWPYDSAAGTDNNPGNLDLYRVQIYSGGGVLQETRYAWPPNVNASGSGVTEFAQGDNMISNSQFSEISFTNDAGLTYCTISVSGTDTVTNIAPGWDIVTTGTGTVQVSQIAITDNAVTTNPPYALGLLSSAGITKLWLQQKFNQSPRLFGLSFLNGSFVGLATSGSPTITMTFGESDGSTWDLGTGTMSSVFGSFQKTTEITPVTSTASPATGYSVVYLQLPLQVQVEVSSLQLLAVASLTDTTGYIQESVARQEDHLFHYYNPLLQYKPIPSYLIGWNFPYNPAQFAGRTVAASAIGANKSKYVWDQTIIFQSANSGVGVTGGSAGEIVLTAAATTQMAIIQYLDTVDARKVLNDAMAVHVAAKASVATNATISLWYTTDGSLPAMGSSNSLVATLDANGKPATFNGNWTEVPRSSLGNALFTIGTSSTTKFNDYGFSGWNLNGAAAANTATYFAIVIGTASVASTNTVSFYDISLCSGNIPTRSAPKSQDEVIRECQYYYEKSYPNTNYAGDTTAADEMYFTQRVAAAGAKTASFNLIYKTIKRTSPTVNFYDPNGSAAGVVLAALWNNGTSAVQTPVSIANWALVANGIKGIAYSANGDTTIAVGTGNEAFIAIQYTADARLGIV